MFILAICEYDTLGGGGCSRGEYHAKKIARITSPKRDREETEACNSDLRFLLTVPFHSHATYDLKKPLDVPSKHSHPFVTETKDHKRDSYLMNLIYLIPLLFWKTQRNEETHEHSLNFTCYQFYSLRIHFIFLHCYLLKALCLTILIFPIITPLNFFYSWINFQHIYFFRFSFYEFSIP